MRKTITVILLGVAVLSLLGQEATNKYQPGTVVDIKEHAAGGAGSSSVTRYDISLQVGKTVYVVLYTPAPGTYGAQYTKGMSLLVLVGSKTVTFSDVRGISREAPILSSSAAASPDKH
jgi:hypothetical protein